MLLENMTRVNLDPELRAVGKEIFPEFARHKISVLTNVALFTKINALRSQLHAPARTEDARVIELLYRQFIRSGVLLTRSSHVRLSEIAVRFAELGVIFSRNTSELRSRVP